MAKTYSEKAKGEVGTSTRRNEEERNLWKGIWSMNIKKKVQHFIWRECHNRLPVSSSLRKRGIELDETCKLCGEEKKTVEHPFFHCVKAKMIWKMAPVQWDGLIQQTTSFKEWWRTLENATDRNEMEIGRNYQHTSCGIFGKIETNGLLLLRSGQSWK